MKLRYLLGMTFAVGLIGGCSTDYMDFKGGNFVQFSSSAEEVYTFAYFSSEKQKDTLNIGIMSIGEVVDYPRTIRFEQVTKEWEYTYDAEDPNKVVDSVYVDMKFPAVKGVHFEAFGGENNELILPANQNEIKVKIVVKREDESLRTEACKLELRLLPSDDFRTGVPKNIVKKITISDKLERPTIWKDTDYTCSIYLGNWSEVKHRFMIDVTGEKWDNDFIKVYIKTGYQPTPEGRFLLQKIKKELENYNADPANNPPLMDENGHEVVFP